MKHNLRDYNYQQRYMWYVQDESEPFDQELKCKNMPSGTLVQDVAKSPEKYPYAVEHAMLKSCTPSIAYNPDYVVLLDRPSLHGCASIHSDQSR